MQSSAAPFHVVLNPGSGKHDVDDIKDAITAALTSSGRAVFLHQARDGASLEALARDVVLTARGQNGVVVAAGGDGTINAVARATLGSGCCFGVVPLGTFNYFSRAHGIPSDVATACGILLTARAQPVQVGQINERAFLVNGSIGLYPDLLEEREDAKQRLGRSRLVALGAALMTLLRPHRMLRLEVEAKRDRRTLITPTLFVGNNRLQLLRVGIPEAELVEQHRLVAVAPRPVGFWGMLGLIVRAAFGRLGTARDVAVLDFERMTVRSRFGKRTFKVAMDGEVELLQAPLIFQVAPHPLLLIRPEDAGEDPG